MRKSIARFTAALTLGLALTSMAGPAWAVFIDAFGAKAGVAYVWPDFQFEGEELADPSAVLEPSVGVFVELRRDRRSRFNLLTELKFTRKGYEADRSQLVPEEVDPAQKVSANFLSVPLLLRSNVSDGELSLYLFFGPSVEILLSSDDDPILNRFNALALAGYAGLGFEYELNRSASLIAELRFNSEFTNAYQSDEDLPLRSVHHRILELLVGGRF